ncbi:non-ribosomal peptide synthetase [Actinoalloteichus sp. AHMU CJ021]|uniref:non-ribosomal peptide synthetase n=1 Tax=Actinoalloteichus sp. AHMU CJ021 TaxID=2072503 RepID=UPI000CA08049|nr:non-ribosomal peptide synthetase [Actinoalloteichus sp. AHMU CJ021]
MSASHEERVSALPEDLRELLRKRLAGQSSPAAPAPGPGIPKVDGEPAPLAPSQRRLWMMHQYEAGGAGYNSAFGVRLRGPLDVPALRRALNALVERHEALRTTIQVLEGTPTQRIGPPGSHELEELDFRDAARPAESLDEAVIAFVDEPFDLERGSLCRILLARLSDAEHVLVLCAHHIVIDGWSTGVLLDDLGPLYSAETGAAATAPRHPSGRYVDFAHWQHRQLGTTEAERQLAYWRERLAGVEPLELPLDRPRPAVRRTEGATTSFTVPAGLTERLRDLGSTHDTSLFTVVFAGFQLLLARYSPQDDITLGTTVSGRGRPEWDRTVGFFANNLAIRTRIDRRSDFATLLNQVRATLLDAYAHDLVPFDRVVEAVQPKRDASRGPIFQALMLMQNTDSPLPELADDITAQEYAFPRTTTNHDLLLELTVHGDELRGHILYSTALFDADTVDRLARNYLVLLESAVHDPRRPVNRLPVLTADERRAVLLDWNDTDRDTGAGTLLDLLAEQVENHPSRPALVGEDTELDYARLDRLTNQWAHHLRDLGVDAETRVAVCLPRSATLWTVALGVIKAGGVHVPLDPENPEERLRYVLADAKARVVVSDRRTLDRIGSALPEDAAVVAVDDADQRWRDAPTAPAATPTPVDHAAYLIYTSGSTGQPKGVLVGHRGLPALARDMADRYGITSESRVAQLASSSFDVSVKELLMALASGAALVLAPGAGPLVGEPLLAALRRGRVTHAMLLPATLASVTRVDAPDLRVVATGAELCPAETVRRWSAPTRRLYNSYGPTEATIAVTLSPSALPPNPGTAPPMGAPIRRTRLHVLDDALCPVPIGAPGELYVAGDSLARGYLGRPAGTAERFVADPFDARGGRRMYRTGDIVRWLATGEVEYLGRADDQVKVSGFRIEPGEIENVLLTHPAVAQAAVTVRDDPPTGRALVAYVSPATTPAPSGADVRAHVALRLPDYMVPARVVTLDELPLTATGKVDRAALPAPTATPPSGAAASGASESERLLCGLFGEVLGVSSVGVEDSFFELGGDSIRVIELVSRARRAGVRLAVKDVVVHQTVSGLVGMSEDIAGSGSTPSGGGGHSEGAPLGPVQRRFFEDRRHPEHLTMSVLLELDADAEAATVEQAVEAVVERHPALTTRFIRTADGWRQQPGGGHPTSSQLTVRDLGGLDVDRWPEAMDAVAAETQASLDLAAGALFKAVLFLLGDEPPRLFLTAHHLAVDGVSWRVLLADLERGYLRARDGEPGLEPPTSASFTDWTRALLTAVRAGRFDDQLGHWTAAGDTRGAGAPPVDNDGDNTVGSTRVQRFRLDRADTRALLTTLPRTHRAQLHEVLLGAVARTLGAWTDQDEVVISLEGHGREDLVGVDVSETVGWFTSVFPIRVPLPPDPEDWDDLLRTAKETFRSVPDKGLGYGALRYLGDADAEPLRRQEPPSTSLNYLGVWRGNADSGLFRDVGEDIGRNAPDDEARAHELEIVAIVRDGCLDISITHSVNRHHESTVRRWGDVLVDNLRRVVRHCREAGSGAYTPSDFPLVSLTQPQLDSLTAGPSRVEDIYPLTPMQAGILFHSLALADGEHRVTGASPYLNQLCLTLRGVSDAEALRDAWRAVVAATPALRTAVRWSDVEEPVQVVHRDVDPPVTVHDWRDLDEDTRAETQRALLAEDIERGIGLAEIHTGRVHIARTAPDTVVVVWIAHHLVMDGWSRSQLFHDLVLRYFAGVRGQVPRLTTRRPFRDYVTWLGSQDVDAAVAHWTATLSNLDGPTPLPYDRPPGPDHEARCGGKLVALLTAEETERLRAVARRLRITVNTVLQGTWALLLSRFAGSTDIVWGTTTSGRSADLPGAGTIVGNLINTIPLRARITPGTRLADWLRDLHLHQATSEQHSHLALSDIARRGGRTHSGRLFDSLAVFENYPFDATIEDLRVEDVIGTDTNTFPLCLSAYDQGRLTTELFYDEALFEEGTARALLAGYQVLLRSVVESPDRPVADHSPLSRAARRDFLLASVGPRPASSVHPGGIHRLFTEQAARTPTTVALRGGGEEMTFAELDERSSRLAHALIEAGATRGRVVGVALPRGTDAVVAILATLKAGAAYTPLDPGLPTRRLTSILADCPVSVIVHSSRDRLDPSLFEAAASLDVVADAGLISGQRSTPPPVVVLPGDLAYVVHTSGSTGRPKGVMVEHANLTHIASAWDRLYGLRDKRLQLASVSGVSVDLFFADLLRSTFFGGTMVIVDQEVVTDPRRLLAALHSHGCTAMELVPTLARTLVEEIDHHGGALPELDLMFVGGEGWPTADCAALLRHLTGATTVFNSYGATEITVDSCAFVPTPDVDTNPGFVPIGGPIDDTNVYLLDAHLGPVPQGVVGELYVSGGGVSRGYLGQPGLTAHRFVADPFSDEGGRLYRTGDRARRRSDGELEFVGRVDHQVKIRGHRVELGELETAMAHHPDLVAAVAALRGTEHRPLLVAYGVPAPNSSPSTDDIHRFLSVRLPTHLLPSSVVLLPELPTTTSGKVDRNALPDPDERGRRPRAGLDRPRGEVERVVAATWEAVLGVERIGATDNFFELGGDSIRTIQVVSRLRRAFDVNLSPQVVFAEPTVRGLARLVDRSGAARIPARTRSGATPQSYAQQRLWFLHAFQPGGSEYNSRIVLRLDGPLHAEPLRQALATLAARHEALRTTFDSAEGHAVQVIHPEGTIPLAERDLSGEPGERRAKLLDEALSAEARRTFDLRTGPLVVATLYRVAAEEHVLFLNMHHIVTDGRTAEILLTELAALYGAAFQGTDAGLPEPPLQYGDFARWQRERLADGRLDQGLDYWRDRLRGLPALELPLDRPRPPVRTTRGDSVGFALPRDISDGLDAFARRHGTTVFTVLLAASQWLLSRYTGQRDIPVGTVVTGRDHPDLQDVVGFFVNTLVVRSDVDPDRGFDAHVDQVHTVLAEAFSHQGVPFDLIVDSLQPDRDPSRSALFDVMVVMQDGGGPVPDFGRARAEEVDITGSEVAFDLTIQFRREVGEVLGAFAYRTDLFERATIDRMVAQLRQLLDAALTATDRPMGELTTQTIGERQLLSAWNASEAPEDSRSVHELFARHARRTPDAVAVVAGGERYSYQTVDARANQLAHHLIARGVDRDVLVGICLPRGVDLVVAALAVLRAGAAFVSLDPEYPRARLEQLVDDSQVPHLLTSLGLRDELPPHTAAVILLDQDAAEIAGRPATDPQVPVHPHNLAYAVYTSGSTGRPKGVLVHHGALAAAARNAAVRCGLGPTSRMLQHLSFSFDGGIWDLALGWYAGAALCFAEGARTTDLADEIRQLGITALFAPPALLDTLNPEDLSGLEVVGAAGETCPVELARRWSAHHRLVNVYGPSETTLVATMHDARPGPGEDTVPVGGPLPGVRLHVLDSRLAPAPIGAPGELHISGVGVGRGYANDSARTAERFVAAPHGPAGSRMYRTGDIVRWRADGTLDFVGRTDDQVKIRGFRVELAEVETALLRHPEVTKATVVARPDGSGHHRLVAYAVPRSHDPEMASDLRDFASRELPAYMVPALFRTLDALPLSPNGKVDRNALPDIDGEEPTGGPDGAEPPEGEVETAIAETWETVLGVTGVGAHDNFFQLGGDSILSIHAVTAARRKGYSVTTRNLFLHQTLRGFAATAVPEQSMDVANHPTATDEPFPMTPVQRWFFERHPAYPDHFNQSALLELPPDLDLDALRSALNAVVERHAALRTRFPGELRNLGRARHAPPGEPVPLETLDLTGTPRQRWEARMAEAAARHSGLLDVANGPLVSSVVFLRGAQAPLWSLAIHHLAVDTVSWQVVLEDLDTAYRQLTGGAVVDLGPATTSFQHWAEELTRRTREGVFDGERGRWRAVEPAPPLPRDAVAEPGPGATGSVLTEFDEDTTRSLLDRVPAVCRATVRDVLLTAVGAALSRWSGQDRVLIDVEGHGRADLFEDVDLTRTVGWFSTVHPLEITVGSAPASWPRAVRAVRRSRVGVPDGGIAYWALRYLREDADSDPTWRTAPQSEVVVNYLGQNEAGGRVGRGEGLVVAVHDTIAPDRHPDEQGTHVLEVVAGVDDGRLWVRWYHSTSLHRRSTVERLAESLRDILAEIVDGCR